MREVWIEDAVQDVDRVNKGEPRLSIKSASVIPGGWSDAHCDPWGLVWIVIPPGWSDALRDPSWLVWRLMKDEPAC